MTKKPTRLAPLNGSHCIRYSFYPSASLPFPPADIFRSRQRKKISGRRRLAFAPAVEKDNEALLAFEKGIP